MCAQSFVFPMSFIEPSDYDATDDTEDESADSRVIGWLIERPL